MIHALVAEKARGILDRDQLEKYAPYIFMCGHCSTGDIAVYHNVIGKHLHIHNDPAEYERIRYAAEDFLATN
jgi:hypothetical protein